MTMKNKYAKRARISAAKIREVVHYFAIDLTAPGGSTERSEPQYREPAVPGLAGTHAAGL